MITTEKIAIFKKFAGDIDGWARTAAAEEKAAISDADWYEIDGLIQDYALVKKGLASARYAEKLELRMQNAAPSPEDAAELKALIVQWV